MRRLTELLSKPVISLYEGKTEGTIKNVIFSKDLKILKWLVLFDDQEILEQKFLPAKEIFNVGENAVVIKNNISIVPNIASLDEPIQNNPINHSIYTVGGNLIDKVSDVLLDEKNAVQFLELKNGTQMLLSQIAVSGQDTLILQDEQNPIHINSFKQKNFPKISKERTAQKVKIMSAEEPLKEEPIVEKAVITEPAPVENVEEIVPPKIEQETPPLVENKTMEKVEEVLAVENTVLVEEQSDSVEKTVEEKKEEPLTKTVTPKKEVHKLIKPKKAKTKIEVTMGEKKVEEQVKKIKTATFNEVTARPTRILSNNNFLLSRSATKNVYTYYQELIIRAGEKITSKEINKAFLSGKLQELIKNSK